MIVMGPSIHFHWPLVIPRAIKVMYPLELTFSEYPKNKFEFVLGSASMLDPDRNTLLKAESASAVVVAGGGLTGAETIFFIFNDDLSLSPAVMGSVRKQKQVELKKMNVMAVPRTNLRKLTTQAFLPTTGMTPNTPFEPTGMLDSNGYMKRTSFLKAVGYHDIFVVGDAGNHEDNRGLVAATQADQLIKLLPGGTGQSGNFKTPSLVI
ncbi:hypothetical protein BGZ63DRAFT_417905 [Mariannaea sp. PMI_226]|nr:hypothetical protein BGZ63DRAFT_417905 [Mariannaea sp. PMI_226]